jgi:hypothetical protein
VVDGRRPEMRWPLLRPSLTRGVVPFSTTTVRPVAEGCLGGEGALLTSRGALGQEVLRGRRRLKSTRMSPHPISTAATSTVRMTSAPVKASDPVVWANGVAPSTESGRASGAGEASSAGELGALLIAGPSGVVVAGQHWVEEGTEVWTVKG